MMRTKDTTFSYKYISLLGLLAGGIAFLPLTATAAEIKDLTDSLALQPATGETSATEPQTEAPQQIADTSNLPSEAVPPIVPTSSETEPLTSVSQLASENESLEPAPMAQFNRASRFSDVRPTDWAFQALQDLVKRYDCLVGYPDGTFRGNRALTRYEFAAGLNACTNQIERLLTGTNFVTREDLETLRRLMQEFETELASLGTRVDRLEARTTFLEDHQFSTTTKLRGQVILSLAGAYGAYPGPGGNAAPNNTTLTGLGPANTRPGNDSEVVFNNRVRLNLQTSFTGKDALIVGLQAYNFGGGFGNATSSIAGTLGYGDGLFGTNSNVRLAYEPQFGATTPSTLGNAPGANNSVGVYKLLYLTPVTDRLAAFIAPAAEVDDAFPALVPFYGDGEESISRFGQMNPVLRVSGGTSGFGLASAVGVIWNIADGVDLRALYGTVNASLPANLGFPGTPLGAGIFGGSYVAAAQLTLKPLPALDVALNYAHSYHQINILGIGEGASDIGAIPNVAATTPVHLNSFGATAAYRLSPEITLAGFFFYSKVDAANSTDAGADFMSYMAGIHFKDLLKEGNTLGLLFGQPPARVGTSGVASLVPRPENSKPYHLEVYYKYRVNDNISITPGVFVLFNPEGFSGNRTTYVPMLRTTFTF